MPRPARSNAPPDSLRILGRDFSVNMMADDDLPGRYGQMDPMRLALDIRNTMDTFDTRDTVVHEVFHAIRFAQGREGGGKVEEDYVRSLATGLIGVLQDNPAFARWLLKPFPKQ